MTISLIVFVVSNLLSWLKAVLQKGTTAMCGFLLESVISCISYGLCFILEWNRYISDQASRGRCAAIPILRH